MNEKREYPISDLAKILPDMQENEFAGLKADIKANGLLEPIYTHEGEVIDGRHRLRACVELGIEPRYEPIDNIDPVRFVWSKNLRRRNFSQSQKAMAIVLLTEWPKRGRPQNNSANLPNFPTLDRKEMAEQEGVSLRLINDSAALVHPDSGAVPELIDAAKQGIVSVTDARKVKDESRRAQRRGLELKTRNKVKTVKAGVDQASQEFAPKTKSEKKYIVPFWSMGEGVTLLLLDLPGLRDCVEPATVDVVIAVPPDDPGPGWFSDLTGLAAHAQTDEGVLVVPAGAELMKEAMIRLNHKKLSFVYSISVQFPCAVCPPVEPHWLEVTQIPLLVYGMPGYRLFLGPDVIAVPHMDKQWESWRYALDAAMEPVLRRFATDGEVVLNPELGCWSGVARAARMIDCRFIGADPDVSRLETLVDEPEALEDPAPPATGVAASEATDAPRGDGDGSTPLGPEEGDAKPERSAGVAGQDGPEPGEATSSHVADGVEWLPTDPEPPSLDEETSPEGTVELTSDAYAPSPQPPAFDDTKADDGADNGSAYSTRPEAGAGLEAYSDGERHSLSWPEEGEEASVSASPGDADTSVLFEPVVATAAPGGLGVATEPHDRETSDEVIADPLVETGGNGGVAESPPSSVWTIQSATGDETGELDSEPASSPPLQGELF